MCGVLVKGEDDKTITAGSLVTVTVQLRREPLIDMSFGDNDVADDLLADEQEDKVEDADEDESVTQVTPSVWFCEGKYLLDVRPVIYEKKTNKIFRMYIEPTMIQVFQKYAA